MIEKPIIMRASSIHGIQQRIKFQTRRDVKIPSWTWDTHKDLIIEDGNVLAKSKRTGNREIIAPPYSTGMRLWVRESFSPNYFDDGSPAYKADYNNEKIGNVVPEPKWKPSIHMPRMLTRYYLDIKAIRPERLLNISDEDCIAEGIAVFTKDRQLMKYAPPDSEGDGPIWPWRECPANPKEAYMKLWDEINADGGLISGDNPVVWVITFERVDKK